MHTQALSYWILWTFQRGSKNSPSLWIRMLRLDNNEWVIKIHMTCIFRVETELPLNLRLFLLPQHPQVSHPLVYHLPGVSHMQFAWRLSCHLAVFQRASMDIWDRKSFTVQDLTDLAFPDLTHYVLALAPSHCNILKCTPITSCPNGFDKAFWMSLTKPIAFSYESLL